MLFFMFDLACVESQWELCDAITRIWLDICADAVLCRVFLDRGNVLHSDRFLAVY